MSSTPFYERVSRIWAGAARHIDRKRTVAVFGHPSKGEPTLPCGVQSPSSRRYFSSWGDLDAFGTDIDQSAHYLSELGPGCEAVVLYKWAIPIAPSIPLAAILAELMVQMERGSRMHIEVAGTWINSDWLEEMIPGVTVEPYSDEGTKWLMVEVPEGIQDVADSLACSFGWLLSNRSEFRDFYQSYLQWLESTPHKMPFLWDGDIKEDENPFEAMFSYGLSWALITRSIFDQVTRQYELEAPLNGVDIGGAHGFLASELALMGHEIVNVDLFGQRFRVMDWIVEGLGVQGRVSGIWTPMETYANDGGAGEIDFACFTNSLVCIDRDHVVSTVEQVSKMLRPNGFILIRENVGPEPRKIGNLTKFSHQELRSILQSIGGKLQFFNHLGLRLEGDAINKAGTWFVSIRFD